MIGHGEASDRLSEVMGNLASEVAQLGYYSIPAVESDRSFAELINPLASRLAGIEASFKASEPDFFLSCQYYFVNIVQNVLRNDTTITNSMKGIEKNSDSSLNSQ